MLIVHKPFLLGVQEALVAHFLLLHRTVQDLQPSLVGPVGQLDQEALDRPKIR